MKTQFFYSDHTLPETELLTEQEETAGNEVAANMMTADQIAEIIAKTIASLKVYVVESEITDAQNSVKVAVEQATF